MDARIEPLGPPYTPDVDTQLKAMMPPGVPPILLFRTFAKHPAMTSALMAWGGYELSDQLSLGVRDREIVIDRVCARCRCEYEWGVHVAFFAERAELTSDQVASLTHGAASDPCWSDERDRLLIEIVDQLHETSTIDEALFDRARTVFDEPQLLDLFLLVGWYHAISFCANAAGVELEDFAPRFDDLPPQRGRS